MPTANEPAGPASMSFEDLAAQSEEEHTVIHRPGACKFRAEHRRHP